MTLLALANYALQLFFIRLTRCKEKHITGFKPHAFSITPGGSTMSGIIKDYDIIQWYSIQYWIVPFTGWHDDFVFIGKGPHFLRITKKKKL